MRKYNVDLNWIEKTDIRDALKDAWLEAIKKYEEHERSPDYLPGLAVLLKAKKDNLWKLAMKFDELKPL